MRTQLFAVIVKSTFQKLVHLLTYFTVPPRNSWSFLYSTTSPTAEGKTVEVKEFSETKDEQDLFPAADVPTLWSTGQQRTSSSLSLCEKFWTGPDPSQSFLSVLEGRERSRLKKPCSISAPLWRPSPGTARSLASRLCTWLYKALSDARIGLFLETLLSALYPERALFGLRRRGDVWLSLPHTFTHTLSHFTY